MDNDEENSKLFDFDYICFWTLFDVFHNHQYPRLVCHKQRINLREIYDASESNEFTMIDRVILN